MRRLTRFCSLDTARDTQLLQVWEQALGIRCCPWGEYQSTRSHVAGREPTCHKTTMETDLIMLSFRKSFSQSFHFLRHQSTSRHTLVASYVVISLFACYSSSSLPSLPTCSTSLLHFWNIKCKKKVKSYLICIKSYILSFVIIFSPAHLHMCHRLFSMPQLHSRESHIP